MSCLANNDATKLVFFEGYLTLSKASNGVQLSILSRLIKKTNLVKAVAFLTLRLGENFNVGKKFSPSQASIMALDLVEIFGHETLEDVVLMFKYARQGRIGDGKDFKLDSQTVFHKWVPDYLELKCKEREKDNEESKAKLNNILNFKWSKDDLDKFKTSDKVQMVREGLGARMRNKIGTPKGYTSPIRDRGIYLNLLKETCKSASIEELQMSIEKSEEKGNEPDALEVMKLELKNKN